MKKIRECHSIYVGGPISLGGTLGPEEIEANLMRFYDTEARLQTLGIAVFNPARLPKHNRLGEPSSQEDYMEQCVWMVMQADGMVALDGWQDSEGTLTEALVAKRTGKPIFAETFEPAYWIVEAVVIGERAAT